MRWLDSMNNLMDMNLSKLQEIVKDRGGRGVTVHGVAKSRTWLNNNTPAFIPWCMCWWEWRLGHFQREMNFWQYVEMHVCMHRLISMSRKGSYLVHFFNTFLLSIDSVRKSTWGTSLAVQWLRPRFPMQRVWIQSLVGEVRPHMPPSVAKNLGKKKKKTFDNTEYPFLKKVLSKLEQGMKGVTINLQLTS